MILRPQPLISLSVTGGLPVELVLEAGVGTMVGTVVEVAESPLGAVVGEAVNISAPDRALVVVPDGAGVAALLLLPLVAVVPQPHTTKNWSSSTTSKAPLPFTSPVGCIVK